MDSILNLLANGENWRLLATLVAIYCFYVSMKSQMKDLGHSIKELRGDMDAKINELRCNDFAHLSSAFEALTFTLEKNGSLSKEDKEFVDGRMTYGQQQ